MSSKLAGTVAVVTGASSGIGRSTAVELARRGASVVAVARRRDRLDELVAEIEQAGGTALAAAADITVRAEAESVVTATIAQYGRLDVLVNNAGLMILGDVEDSDPDDWDQMISVNQRGLLHMTKASLPHLKKAAQGPREVADIVNISSVAGRSAHSTMGVYNMTKFGVNGFTEALRQELAASHVRVGVLEPGKVATELDSHNNEEILDYIGANFSGFRMLDPDDIADGVAYMTTRPAHTAIGELWIMPTEQG
ncbi:MULTISPECIES: SDR family NAD(P)-dependent oxidoreductase [Actinomycetes]|uniref:SDR family oxidoreductase n=1 Tax=Actinomycetes TaxID=1760 RepID=UPI0004BED76D|nr:MULTISPECIES: SDR family NAD(P)-dependent oxidoreductase [Actinomycetes]